MVDPAVPSYQDQRRRLMNCLWVCFLNSSNARSVHWFHSISRPCIPFKPGFPWILLLGICRRIVLINELMNRPSCGTFCTKLLGLRTSNSAKKPPSHRSKTRLDYCEGGINTNTIEDSFFSPVRYFRYPTSQCYVRTCPSPKLTFANPCCMACICAP